MKKSHKLATRCKNKISPIAVYLISKELLGSNNWIQMMMNKPVIMIKSVINIHTIDVIYTKLNKITAVIKMSGHQHHLK